MATHVGTVTTVRRKTFEMNNEDLIKVSTQRLPLWDEKQKEISESDTVNISDNELAKKIQQYHSKCLKWKKRVQEWLNANT